MFTGIIQEVGTVERTLKKGGGLLITIQGPKSAAELDVNASVAINGVCQTVIDCRDARFMVEAVEETLRKTTLGELREGSPVNLELPLRLNDRMGGHLVQGHVDGVGSVRAIRELESSRLLIIEIPQEFSRYVVPVGSIAVDGVSLTIATLEGSHITIALIPHTLENTTLRLLRAGSKVNLEFDLIGKYVERLMSGSDADKSPSTLTTEKLKMWGYEG